MARGPVTVRLQTEVETRWRPIPTLTAEIRGARGPLRPPQRPCGFVALRRDGQRERKCDDAGDRAHPQRAQGRVATRAAARLLVRPLARALRRIGMVRGQFLRRPHDHCVCHVNAESTGGMGATNLADAGCMAETWQFAAGPIRDVRGQELRYRRLARNGDQSFEGVGIPSALAGLSSQPEGGLGWWWHTPDDTLDKIDGPNFVRDTQVYLLVCWRLCTAACPPLRLHRDGKRTARPPPSAARVRQRSLRSLRH